MKSIKKKIEENIKKSNSAHERIAHALDYDIVNNAVQEFEKRFYDRNKPHSKDANKKIMDLFKEIFGNW